jgi:hypothetical protein
MQLWREAPTHLLSLLSDMHANGVDVNCSYAGQALRERLLRHGGAVEPTVLLSDLLGSDALYQHPSGGWSPRDAQSLLMLL